MLPIIFLSIACVALSVSIIYLLREINFLDQRLSSLSDEVSRLRFCYKQLYSKSVSLTEDYSL